MILYQVQIPIVDNQGKAYDHTTFKGELVRRFGGYTCFWAQGSWRDDSGKVYNDPQIVYQIATDDREAWIALLWGLPHYFRGQQAWFHAEVGQAWIS